MPYGAHETLEAHEILMEKINMLTHFNLYAKQAKNPQLLNMIVRHQQEEIRSYNELVALTHGNNRFSPIPPNTTVRGISNQDIQYGLNNPPQFAPQADASLSDSEIAVAMLCCHKNAARNSSWASLECADPNLRRFFLNSSANCNNQAYEVFLFMNQQGVYQVPTLNSQTAETFMNRYQPADRSLEAQYASQNGQNAGYTGQYTGYTGQSAYGTGNVAGTGNGTYAYANSVGTTNGNNIYVGSRESVLYGNGTGGSASQYQAVSPSVYGNNINSQGTTTQQ